MSGQRVTFLLGCTACGKSAVGFELAKQIDAEIVAIDSMKVYRRMNIGTAKPSADNQAEVRHHLIDVVEPSDEFNVADYVHLAEQAIREIAERGKSVLIVGGTALYIKGLSQGLFDGPGEDPAFRTRLRERAKCEGTVALHEELRRVDPEAADRIHPNDYRRIERALEVFAIGGTPISKLQTQWEAEELKFDCRFVGLRREKEDQSHRINARVKRMMLAGLLDEVRSLLAEEKPLSHQARQAVGYAELIDHLSGKMSLDEAVEQIKINSRRLAKSQRTWFKRFRDVAWFDLDEEESTTPVVERIRSWYDALP